jgi:hypothetical protein
MKFIVIILFLFVSNNQILAQTKILQFSSIKTNAFLLTPTKFIFNKTNTSQQNFSLLFSPVKKELLPPNYYTQCFGFICKKELQFEKFTKIPLRFRLGSLAYVNYLEGK